MRKWSLLLLILAAGATAQNAPRIADGPSGSPHPVRVMSFNLRYGLADDGEDSWPNRRDLVGDTVLAFAPDLLGVQECLGFQAEYLKGRLPGWDFVGAGRDDGATGGEMCAVFFRQDRFELLDAGHFWLSPTPAVVGSVGWDAALTRMATWVKLRTRTDDPVTFVFANTHFDHVGPEARRQSAQVIQDQLLGIAGDLPVILTGDFNAPADPADHGPYQVLVQANGWQDSYRSLHPAGPGQGTFNGFQGEENGPRIDWILTRGGPAPLAGDIVRTGRRGRFPSDHFPVTAVIDLIPRP